MHNPTHSMLMKPEIQKHLLEEIPIHPIIGFLKVNLDGQLALFILIFVNVVKNLLATRILLIVQRLGIKLFCKRFMILSSNGLIIILHITLHKLISPKLVNLVGLSSLGINIISVSQILKVKMTILNACFTTLTTISPTIFQ